MKKQLFFTPVVTLVAFQSVLFSNTEEKTSHLSGLEEQIACISECNIKDRLQPKLASAGVECGITLGASFLYQQAIVDLLSSVRQVGFTSVPDGGAVVAVEETDVIDYKWRPGFRVIAGYIFSQREQLGLNIAWTHLEGKGASSVYFDDPTFSKGSLKPTWNPFLLGPQADQATSTWDCKFNLIDGTFGRGFFLGKWLVVHPYAGIRGAWIDQDYQAKYHAAWTVDTTGGGNFALSFRDTSFTAENDFKGVGFLFGLGTDWYLSCNFSVFTNLKTSLLYGKIEVFQFIDGQLIIPIPTIPTIVIPETISQTRSVRRLRPNLEGELGVKWEQFFCNNSYRLFLGVSYEFSFWFFQNMFENTTNYLDGVQNSFATSFVEPRNLQFQGINVQAGFDF